MCAVIRNSQIPGRQEEFGRAGGRVRRLVGLPGMKSPTWRDLETRKNCLGRHAGSSDCARDLDGSERQNSLGSLQGYHLHVRQQAKFHENWDMDVRQIWTHAADMLSHACVFQGRRLWRQICESLNRARGREIPVSGPQPLEPSPPT